MIHPLAYVDPKAQIGENVTIEPFAYVAGDVTIGDNSWIGPHASVMDKTILGKGCRIFPGAVVGAVPQDLKFVGEASTVEIGDNTTIRECVTINRGTADRMKTKIGSNCLLMAYVHVAHDTFVGNNCIIANSVNLAGHITIDDFVIIEGTAAVQQFIHIGAHSFIAGGSLVRKNVPPYIKVAREPLSYIGINGVGLKRRGFSDEVISEIEHIYKTIFIHNQNVSKALDELETPNPSDTRKEIMAFIRNSDKGIVKGA